MEKTSCPLCQAEELTTWYYKDELIWIASCLTCRVPMGVIQRHSMTLTVEEEKDLNDHLNKVGILVFGEGKFYIDREERQILTHLHWHARKK